ELKGYTQVQPEYKYRDSRFDVYLENLYEKCFVEVKNVTYKEDKYALFPDAVTTRGKKHLSDLIKARKEGYRAVMLYIIQRSDVDIFAPAKEIDPEYTKELKKAHKAGVEILPYQVKVSPTEIKLGKKLEFKL
ncbi:MAG: DNA/RNA nuclease SfsA, partial [Marinilabiliales bacterium]